MNGKDDILRRASVKVTKLKGFLFLHKQTRLIQNKTGI